MDPEAEFLNGLIELQFGGEVVPKLKKLSEDVDWANGWPESRIAFWNAEAFMWSHKIKKDVRDYISERLKGLEKGKNLDLGAGAYSYVQSVAFDCSPKMLSFNENAAEKIEGNLERTLPFPDQSFDSVTAIFVMNYVKNLDNLLKEVKRVLKLGASFYVILSAKDINIWQRQKEINKHTGDEWAMIFKKAGFSVSVETQHDLYIFSLF